MDDRYSRLERYPPLGRVLPHWQAARVAVVGCGGLGGGLIQQLARLGVAQLTLVDRDTIGPENLGHQTLFTEADAAAWLPKAVAAAQTVQAINSSVHVEPQVASLDRHNVRDLLASCELVFDGLDNFAGRLLLNDYALATGTPYLYAGVVRGELAARAVVPGSTGCLRCILDVPPAAGELSTCAAEGVFPPLLSLANLLQLRAANQILAGEFTTQDDDLWSFDMASMRLQAMPLGGPAPSCRACAGHYDYLDGLLGGESAFACAPGRIELQLDATLTTLAKAEALLAASHAFAVKRNAWCLTAEAEGRRYTIFPSGRLALSGSDDPLELQRFAATYLGV